MSYRKRQILNRAASDAHEEKNEVREEFVNQIEEMRELVDINHAELSEALGRDEDWYTNSIRGGKTGHDFSLLGYSEARIFLQMSCLYMYEANEIEDEEIERMVEIGAIDEEAVDIEDNDTDNEE